MPKPRIANAGRRNSSSSRNESRKASSCHWAEERENRAARRHAEGGARGCACGLRHQRECPVVCRPNGKQEPVPARNRQELADSRASRHRWPNRHASGARCRPRVERKRIAADHQAAIATLEQSLAVPGRTRRSAPNGTQTLADLRSELVQALGRTKPPGRACRGARARTGSRATPSITGPSSTLKTGKASDAGRVALAAGASVAPNTAVWPPG